MPEPNLKNPPVTPDPNANLKPLVGVIGGENWDTIVKAVTTLRDDPDLGTHAYGFILCANNLLNAFNTKVG